MPKFKATSMVVMEIAELHKQLTQIFNSLHGFLQSEDENLLSPHWRPAMDVYENPQEIVVELEVPGIDPDKLRIKYHNNSLIITGIKHERSCRENCKFLLAERSLGEFQRSIYVPTSINSHKIKATALKGVIRIVLPKISDRRGRTKNIPIENIPDEE